MSLRANGLMRLVALVATGGWLAMVVGCSSAPEEPAPVASKSHAPPRESAEKPAATKWVASATAPVRDSAVSPVAYQEAAGGIPPVLLTNQHAALPKVKVGDAMPEISLPQIGGSTATLSGLYGKAATVVVFWKGDRFMTTEVLSDLGPDVVNPFGAKDVKAVGVAVNETAATAANTIKMTRTTVPQLLDAEGKEFAKVGAQKFPWVFVLDPSGKIVWFDLEYSHATRRELQQTLRALLN